MFDPIIVDARSRPAFVAFRVSLESFLGRQSPRKTNKSESHVSSGEGVELSVPLLEPLHLCLVGRSLPLRSELGANRHRMWRRRRRRLYLGDNVAAVWPAVLALGGCWSLGDYTLLMISVSSRRSLHRSKPY
jgi:hypothetical protein